MPDPLSDVRLVLPPSPPRHIARPRLISALDDVQDTPLTLVAAGPGAGKTVLLSDWARHRAAPTAWLALTPADNEPRHFRRLLLAAMRASGVLTDAHVPATVPRADTIDLLDTLLARIPRSCAPLVLVIDDAHALTNQEVLRGLDSLIRSPHPRLRLVLAARSDPLLPLHRYRLAGQMRELRAADLAMTGSETRELLAAHGVSLPDREFKVLVARTEGWIAGVRLSAIRMEGTPQPADFVAGLALDHGSIGEYLIDEVLDRQPQQVRRLLVETSFLAEVTGGLAEAITGLDGCADMLDELAHSNSFVIPLDRTWSRFRYHQLFAETLRYLLRRRAPQLSATLYRRAAVWFETEGDLENALYWAVRARDQHHVAALLVHGGLERAFVKQQDLATSRLRDVLPMSVPPGAGEMEAAELAAANAAIVAITGDRHTARHDLAEVRAERSELNLSDPDVRMTADLVELILGQKADDHAAVDAATTRLLTDAAQDGAGQHVPGLHACVLLARASMSFWDGQLGDLDAQLDDALANAERDGVPAVQVEVLALMALVNMYLSRHNRADDASSRARALLRELPDNEPPATLELAVAMRAFVTADLTATARAIRKALADDAIGADPVLAAALATNQAEVLLCCGQATEARRVLESGAWADYGKPALLVAYRDILLARIETALGRPRGALHLMQGYRGTPFELAVAVPSAGAYLALGDLRSAQNCVRRVLAGTGGPVTRQHLVEAMLCDAQIAQRSDDHGRALEMLVRALAVANGDIVLPFNQVADVFAPLLARHPTVAARWPTPLADLSGLVSATAIPRRARRLPEALTDRERAVLRFLATSMSTAEISDELCLSVNTVKTHLAAIYRKLAARKRREAVLVARELELL
jgi:LuxR family transcriptional regulator, maltose regulon positive regulatory protein